MATFLELVTREIGVPYVYGGDTPAGFDCSGLVQWAAGQLGVALPRGATDQMHALPHTNEPVAGDLVFFNTGDGWEAGHVGICASNGCAEMIDAPHSGALVRREPVAGFGTVVAYGRLPGAAAPTSSGNATLASIDLPLPGGGVSLPDPTDALGDIPGVSEILDAIGSLPGQVLKVLLGGHTPGELALRFVEISGGALVFAAGLVTLLLVVAEGGGQTGRAARGVGRAGRRIDRAGRGSVRRVRETATPQRAPRSRTQADRRRLDALLRAERGSGRLATRAGRTTP